MKYRLFFACFIFFTAFIPSYVFADPIEIKGTFTVAYDVPTDSYVITVKTSDDQEITFFCDLGSSHWVHRFNYGYGDDFLAAALVGDDFVVMEYHVFNGQNLIVNSPAFS